MRHPWAAYSGLIFVALGLAIAAGGIQLSSRTLATGAMTRLGNDVRNGGLELSQAVLVATAARLDAASAEWRTGEEAGALTFLYYAAARSSMANGNAAEAQQELAAAAAAARQTLQRAPTRADVSLALGEIEYLTGGTRDAMTKPLLLSYQTAPRELWIIERRIGLGLRLADRANPELRRYIVSDIRTLGDPFRDTVLYLELARAAFNAGPYATALVRHELASINDQPLQAFNQDIEKLQRPPRPGTP